MKSANSIVIALCSGILGSLFGWCLMLPAPFLLGPVLVSTLFAILRTNFSVPEQIKRGVKCYARSSFKLFQMALKYFTYDIVSVYNYFCVQNNSSKLFWNGQEIIFVGFYAGTSEFCAYVGCRDKSRYH